MSFQTKRQAQYAADKLIKSISFGEWKPRVHENLGWHASVQWRFISIGIYKHSNAISYSILFGHDGTGIAGLNSHRLRVEKGEEHPSMDDFIKNAIKVAIKELMYYTVVANVLKKIK